MHSANDDFAATLHPTPSVRDVPAKNMLPRLPNTPSPRITVSMPALASFIIREMTLRGSHVCWKGDGYRLVPHTWGQDLEVMLKFRVGSDLQIVRHADVAWMLCHHRAIPDGHRVHHSDGNVRNGDTHNLWLTEIG